MATIQIRRGLEVNLPMGLLGEPLWTTDTFKLFIGDGVTNHQLQAWDSDLDTIAGLTATTDNFIVSVASAWASRTPAQVKTTLALNNVENTALSTWAGTTNITTLGTISSGTWNGGIIPLTYGGTSANLTANTGGILYSGASALAILSGTATAGKVLQSGATAAPTWSTPTYPSVSGTSGKIIRADGTNNVYSTFTIMDTFAQGDILYASASNTVSGVTKDTSATRYLSNQGASNSPSWNLVNLTNGVTGALPILNGGTGQTTANTAFNALVPSQTSNSGKYLTTDGTNTSWGTVSGGASISALTLATAANTIDNTNYAQNWQWSTLAAGNGLNLTSTSTVATSNTQTLFNVALSGANGTSTQTTYAAQITNTHTGTASSNTALYLSASGGTKNNALVVNSGNVVIGDTSSVNFKLEVYGNGDFNGISVSNIQGVGVSTYISGGIPSIVGIERTLGSYNNIIIRSSPQSQVVISTTGATGIRQTSPTAFMHIGAGTATANTAPLKLTSGTNLTTAEAGAMEYNGTNLFFTRSGTTRESVMCANSVNSVSPTAPNRTITIVIDGNTYYIAAKTTND